MTQTGCLGVRTHTHVWHRMGVPGRVRVCVCVCVCVATHVGNWHALSPRPKARDHQRAPGVAASAQKAAQMCLQPSPMTALERLLLRHRNPAAPIHPTSPHLPSRVGAGQACLLAVVRRLGRRPHGPAPDDSGCACVDWKWALGWPRTPCAVKRRALSQSVALMRSCKPGPLAP